MSEKFVWFDGLKYTKDEKTGYYLNSTHRKRLHRAVWEYHNGPIPKGYHIHHKDFNKNNNDLSNLTLIESKAHEKLHGDFNSLFIYDEQKKRMDYARTYASEWHSSTEGRAWHKRQYEVTKAKLHEMKNLVCDFCGKNFMAEKGRFCSNKCKSAWRRKQGLDDVIKVCGYCGKEFKTNKYSKAKYCSHTCSNRAEPRLPFLRKDKKD